MSEVKQVKSWHVGHHMRKSLETNAAQWYFCAFMLHVSSPDHILNLVGNFLDYSSIMGFLKTTKKTL